MESILFHFCTVAERDPLLRGLVSIGARKWATSADGGGMKLLRAVYVKQIRSSFFKKKKTTAGAMSLVFSPTPSFS